MSMAWFLVKIWPLLSLHYRERRLIVCCVHTLDFSLYVRWVFCYAPTTDNTNKDTERGGLALW